MAAAVIGMDMEMMVVDIGNGSDMDSEVVVMVELMDLGYCSSHCFYY